MPDVGSHYITEPDYSDEDLTKFKEQWLSKYLKVNQNLRTIPNIAVNGNPISYNRIQVQNPGDLDTQLNEYISETKNTRIPEPHLFREHPTINQLISTYEKLPEKEKTLAAKTDLFRAVQVQLDKESFFNPHDARSIKSKTFLSNAERLPALDNEAIPNKWSSKQNQLDDIYLKEYAKYTGPVNELTATMQSVLEKNAIKKYIDGIKLRGKPVYSTDEPTSDKTKEEVVFGKPSFEYVDHLRKEAEKKHNIHKTNWDLLGLQNEMHFHYDRYRFFTSSIKDCFKILEKGTSNATESKAELDALIKRVQFYGVPIPSNMLINDVKQLLTELANQELAEIQEYKTISNEKLPEAFVSKTKNTDMANLMDAYYNKHLREWNKEQNNIWQEYLQGASQNSFLNKYVIGGVFMRAAPIKQTISKLQHAMDATQDPYLIYNIFMNANEINDSLLDSNYDKKKALQDSLLKELILDARRDGDIEKEADLTKAEGGLTYANFYNIMQGSFQWINSDNKIDIERINKVLPQNVSHDNFKTDYIKYFALLGRLQLNKNLLQNGDQPFEELYPGLLKLREKLQAEALVQMQKHPELSSQIQNLLANPGFTDSFLQSLTSKREKELLLQQIEALKEGYNPADATSIIDSSKEEPQTQLPVEAPITENTAVQPIGDANTEAAINSGDVRPPPHWVKPTDLQPVKRKYLSLTGNKGNEILKYLYDMTLKKPEANALVPSGYKSWKDYIGEILYKGAQSAGAPKPGETTEEIDPYKTEMNYNPRSEELFKKASEKYDKWNPVETGEFFVKTLSDFFSPEALKQQSFFVPPSTTEIATPTKAPEKTTGVAPFGHKANENEFNEKENELIPFKSHVASGLHKHHLDAIDHNDNAYHHNLKQIETYRNHISDFKPHTPQDYITAEFLDMPKHSSHSNLSHSDVKGCLGCGRIDELHVHDEDPDDINCMSCLGKGLTAHRYEANKLLNLKNLSASEHPKHKEIQTAINNNALLSKLEKNKFNTHMSRFESPFGHEGKFERLWKKHYVETEPYEPYMHDKMIHGLGRYLYDKENTNKNYLHNLNSLVIRHLNHVDPETKHKKEFFPLTFHNFNDLKNITTSNPGLLKGLIIND
jgi:hypothetical protein